MSGFIKRTNTARTVNPAGGIDPAKEPNVGQYGWTKYESAVVTQLTEYVNMCKQYAQESKDAAAYIAGRVGELEDFMIYIEKVYDEIKPIYDNIVPILTEIQRLHGEVIEYHGLTVKLYDDTVQLKADMLQIKEDALVEIPAAKDKAVAEIGTYKDACINDLLKVKTDAIKEVTDVKDSAVTQITNLTKLASDEADRAKREADRSKTEADRSKTQADRSTTEADRSRDEATKSANSATASATSAQASENSNQGSKGWYDKSYELYEELQKGQIYRGTWNPHTNAYPAHQGTNSVWDVILNTGEVEYTWNGIKWFWGDRLVYVKDSNSYQQVESGSTVLSVNDKTGNVTLDALDVNAPKAIGSWPTGSRKGVTTDEFLEILKTKGAFNQRHWISRGEWTYASNVYITDTECGIIELAGAVIEVFNNYTDGRKDNCTIRITTATTSGSESATGVRGDFVYINNGTAYQPGWRRMYNTRYKPTAADVGAVSKTGDTMTGELRLPSGKLLVEGVEFIGVSPDVLRLGNQSRTLKFHSKSTDLILTTPTGDNKVYHTGNKPTASELGALPINGGTVNGDLTVNGNFHAKNAVLVNTANVIGVDGSVARFGDSTYSRVARIAAKDGNLTVNPSSSTSYRVYHEGFKPSAADFGAVLADGSIPFTGNVTIKSDSSDRGIVVNAGNNKNSWTKWVEGDITKEEYGGFIQYDGATGNDLRIGTIDNGSWVTGITMARSDARATFRITPISSVDPTVNDHVANKRYVDTKVSLGGSTMTGQLRINNQGWPQSLEQLDGSKAAIRIPSATFPGGNATYYQEFIHGQCGREGDGYIQHTSFGTKRSGSTGWQDAYIATGGRDASPTKEWLFNYSGTFTSPGDIYVNSNKVWHNGARPALGDMLGSGNSAIKVVTIEKPSGAVDGKYYPVLLNGARNYQEFYIETRSSSGDYSMNNCSFHGFVRSGGWSDRGSYAVGQFTIYASGERALYNLAAGTESDGYFVAYVEARAFPVVVKVNTNVSVTCTGTNTSVGTTTFNAGVTSTQLTDGSFGTKARALQNFDRGNGFYGNTLFPTWITAQNGITAKERVFVDGYNQPVGFLHRRSGQTVYAAFGQASDGSAIMGTSTGTENFSSILKVSTTNLKYVPDASTEYKIYHEGFKPSISDLGALPTTGGKLTGALTIEYNDAAPFELKRGSQVGIKFSAGANTRYLGVDNNGELRYGTNLDHGANAHVYSTSKKPTAADIGAISTSATNINTSVDLNNYENTGFYTMYKGSGVTFTNAPSDFDYGTLQVIGAGKTASAFCMQTLTWRSSGKQQVRARSDNMAWTAWSQVYSSSQKPSPSDIGALALAGGVMTGKLSIHRSGVTGWPNSNVSDSQNYINAAISSHVVNNNGLHIFGDGNTNTRRMAIQAGHSDPQYTTSYGILDLNPYGGAVRANGNTLVHAGQLVPFEGGTLTWAQLLNKIPVINRAGVTELGRYIDMRESESDVDFDWRWDAGGKGTRVLTLYNGGSAVVAQFDTSGNIITPVGSVKAPRVELKTNGTPMIEWHAPGVEAFAAYLEPSNGTMWFSTSNGQGGAIAHRFVSYKTGTFVSKGQFQSQYATNSSWNSVGTMPFYAEPASSAVPGAYTQLVGFRLHSPGAFTIQNSLGAYQETDSTSFNRMCHTLVSTDGGGTTAIWKFRNEGSIQAPGAQWFLPPDGNIYSNRWGNYIWEACVATFQQISDIRFKDVLGDSDKSALDVVCQFQFKKFNWKVEAKRAPSTVEIGLIAQEVEQIDPNFVKSAITYTADGTEIEGEVKGLDAASLLAVALKAIQEQQVQINELKAEVEQLKGRS